MASRSFFRRVMRSAIVDSRQASEVASCESKTRRMSAGSDSPVLGSTRCITGRVMRTPGSTIEIRPHQGGRPTRRDQAFLVLTGVAFLAAAFLAGALLATTAVGVAAFLAGTFLAGTFLAG